MPIIDNVAYNAPPDLALYPRKIILQVYSDEIPPAAKPKNNFTKIFKKMFHLENTNTIRPRKNHTPAWVKHPDHFALAIPASMLPTYENELKYDKRGNLGKAKKVGKALLHQVENYFENSTLHGLRYVGNTALSIGERLFWIVAFASAFAFAAYYISNIFDKWNNNPVLIAFSPFDATLNEIPFPAITICNMNQAKKEEAHRIIKEGTEVEKRLLNEYCNANRSYFGSEDNAPSWETVQNFLIRVGQSCSDMVKACIWENEPMDCNLYFNNDLTDEGLCCSFNRLPPNILFRNANDVPILNQSYPNVTYDWSPEKGFPDPNTGNISIIPIRPSGAGTHLGLTVVINADVDNYFCSSTNSIGFKVIFSNPIESPKIQDFGYLVSPGVETRYAIQPDIREATDTLRNVDIEKRQCYFQSERQLKFYRTYSVKNCRLECQAEYTLLHCRCIPYYLPKNKITKVCGKVQQDCVIEAKANIELVYGNASSCNCLPGCFEISFDKFDTQSNLFKMNSELQMEKSYTDEEFRKNMAVLHFFFKDIRFRKQVKSEIYGFTEALSNIGGLLGLCLGFSFLSFVELVYFLTLRVLCRIIKRKNAAGRNPNIPFMK